MGLRDLLSKLGGGETRFEYGQASPATAEQIWSKYVAYRKAGYLKAWQTRRTPHRVSLFLLDTVVIKEYTGARAAVEQELSILRQLRHENVVGFLFVADQGSRISIVMDWAGESLRDQRSRAGAYFCEATARHMVYQLTHALAYLHAKGIVHRDIKPDNIGVHVDHKVQLFDWGEAITLAQVAGLTDRELGRRLCVAGTPIFMAPEALNYLTHRDAPAPAAACGPAAVEGAHELIRCSNRPYSPADPCAGSAAAEAAAAAAAAVHDESIGGDAAVATAPCSPGAAAAGGARLRRLLTTKLDVWGLGTVAFFLLAGRDIFVADSCWELEGLADVANASGGVELPLGTGASYAARHFLRRCLARDPDERASAKELLGHPWLMGATTAEEVGAFEAAAAAAHSAASTAARTAQLSVLAESFSSEAEDINSSGSSRSRSSRLLVRDCRTAEAYPCAGYLIGSGSTDALAASVALASGMPSSSSSSSTAAAAAAAAVQGSSAPTALAAGGRPGGLRNAITPPALPLTVPPAAAAAAGGLPPIARATPAVLRALAQPTAISHASHHRRMTSAGSCRSLAAAAAVGSGRSSGGPGTLDPPRAPPRDAAGRLTCDVLPLKSTSSAPCLTSSAAQLAW